MKSHVPMLQNAFCHPLFFHLVQQRDSSDDEEEAEEGRVEGDDRGQSVSGSLI